MATGKNFERFVAELGELYRLDVEDPVVLTDRAPSLADWRGPISHSPSDVTYVDRAYTYRLVPKRTARLPMPPSGRWRLMLWRLRYRWARFLDRVRPLAC